MHNEGRGDEFYTVIDDFKLHGEDVEVHAGKKGTHEPEDILTPVSPYYEVGGLNHIKIRELTK
jgi:hypothetical protein